MYTAGYFTSAITVANVSLPLPIGPDFYITKNDVNGNVKWVIQGGGPGKAAVAMSVDFIGNVYILGSFSSTIKLGNTTLIPPSGTDCFVAKYDTNGTFLWARQFSGGHSVHYCQGIAADQTNGVYMSGTYFLTGRYGSTVYAPLSPDLFEGYIIKFSSEGNFLYMKRFTTATSASGAEYIQSLTVDTNNDLIATGLFSNTFTVDGNSLPIELQWNAFAIKFSPEGIVQWMHRYGGAMDAEVAMRVGTDPAGNIYLTGAYVGTRRFGTLVVTSMNSATYSVGAREDMFVYSLDRNGNARWASVTSSGVFNERGTCISGDSQGNVYLVGYFTAPFLFGGVEFSGNGASDTFIIRLNASSGAVLASRIISSEGDDRLLACALNPRLQVMIGGFISGNVTMDSVTYAAQSNDAIVAKVSFACDECPSGTWSDKIHAYEMSSCVKCPSGKYSNQKGVSSVLGCSLCGPGTYSGEGATACSLCPAGTFNPKSDSTSAQDCLKCPKGTYASSTGSSVCLLCAAGTYADEEGSTTCANCWVGSFSTSIGAQSNQSCIPCAAGYISYSEAAQTCDPCGPGTYKDAVGKADCSLCKQGTYNEIYGASSPLQCLPCQAGTYSNVPGAVSQSLCNACPKGTASELVGATSISDCLPCDAGSFSNILGAKNKTEACQPCTEGYYASGLGSFSCSQCSIGTYTSDRGQSLCKVCDAGYESSPNRTSCVKCDYGKFSIFAGAITCTNCSIGTYNDELGATSCKPCRAGTYLSYEGAKSALECVPCSLGEFSSQSGATNAQSCTKCGAGYYNDKIGAAKCEACRGGTYLSSIGAISPNLCLPCGNGTISPVGSISASACTPCSSGFFAPMVNNSICHACEPGSFSDKIGSANCKLCEPGTFNPLLGASQCSLCNIGSYSDAFGAMSCKLCMPGTFAENQGGRSAMACKNCTLGTVAPLQGASSCKACSAGYFAVNSTHCEACSKGYFSVAGSTSKQQCIPCAIGYFAPLQGSAHCLPCAKGKTTNGTASVSENDCMACLAGYFGSQGTCKPCKRGTYSSIVAAQSELSCVECDAGYFNNREAQSSSDACQKCPPGFFNPKSGASLCEPCPENTFASEQGATLCSDCFVSHICSVGSKRPLQNTTIVAVNSARDPYFDQQKLQAQEAANSTQSQMIVIVIVACIVVLIVFLVAIIITLLILIAKKRKWLNIAKVKWVMSYLDLFSLKHYTKADQPVKNSPNWLGGVASVLLLLTLVGIVIVSIIDVVKGGNKIETVTIAPLHSLKVDRIQSNYTLVLRLFDIADCSVSSVDVNGFIGKPNTTASWVTNATQCEILFSCIDCYIQGFPQVQFNFNHLFAMASAFDYTLSVPYFDTPPFLNVSGRFFSDKQSVLRGKQPTQVALSLFTTLRQKIDSADFFFYNLLSGVLRISNGTFESLGYSVTTSPIVAGSTVSRDTFWSLTDPELHILFSFSVNPNCYLIKEQGRSTFLDFFSKIFALTSATMGFLALIMVVLEMTAHVYNSRKKKQQDVNLLELTELK